MDPRIARTHEAVMAAATELLVEGGPSALTVDGVVARSGVAKSTLYRHWATRDDLVADVLSSCVPHLEEVPRDLGFHEALRRLVDEVVVLMQDDHWNRVLPSLLMLKNELGAAADIEDRFKAQQSDVVAAVLQRGVDEGVVPAEVLDDVDLALSLLLGPVVMAGLTGGADLDERLVTRAVAQFLAGLGAPAPEPPPARRRTARTGGGTGAGRRPARTRS